MYFSFDNDQVVYILILRSLVQFVLKIPATSKLFEQLFSIIGLTINAKRKI
jgi:hypothetical protein